MPDLPSLGVVVFMAWLFGHSVWHKLKHPAYYRRLLGSWFDRDRVAAFALPPVVLAELLLVPAILLEASREIALLAAAAVLVLYALFMAWFVRRGRTDLRCGCSGPARDVPISMALVYRNLACATLAVAAARLPAAQVSLLTGATAVLLGLFLCLLYLCCEQLIGNARHPVVENR